MEYKSLSLCILLLRSFRSLSVNHSHLFLSKIEFFYLESSFLISYPHLNPLSTSSFRLWSVKKNSLQISVEKPSILSSLKYLLLAINIDSLNSLERLHRSCQHSQGLRPIPVNIQISFPPSYFTPQNLSVFTSVLFINCRDKVSDHSSISQLRGQQIFLQISYTLFR